jgi:hypothetical protein
VESQLHRDSAVFFFHSLRQLVPMSEHDACWVKMAGKYIDHKGREKMVEHQRVQMAWFIVENQ